MIRRAPRTHRFTVIPDTVTEDGSLSFKALGLLVYLLSKPDHWRVDRDHLATTHADGVTSVRSALRELADAGYLVTESVRGPDGQMAGREAVVYDHPQRSPNGGFPTGRSPNGGKRAPREKTEVAKTDEVPTTSAAGAADAAVASLPGLGPQGGDNPVDEAAARGTEAPRSPGVPEADQAAEAWRLVRAAWDARKRKPLERRDTAAKTVARLLAAGWTEAQVERALVSSPAWTPTALQVELRNLTRGPTGRTRTRPPADDPRRDGESRVVDIKEVMRDARR